MEVDIPIQHEHDAIHFSKHPGAAFESEVSTNC